MTTQENPRFSAPRTLCQNGVPCIIWQEDALKHFGVRTVVFDLFCLVENTEVAANCLQQHGFVRIEESKRPGYQFQPALVRGQPRLTDRPDTFSDDDITTAAVVLIPASPWRYALTELSCDSSKLFPRLGPYFQALVNRWLDLSAEEHYFRGHLLVYIGYLYDYVPEFREPSFIDSLQPAYVREFHSEFLTGAIHGSDRGRFLEMRDGRAPMAAGSQTESDSKKRIGLELEAEGVESNGESK